MDPWFNKKFCDRCGKSLADGFSMSRFDTENYADEETGLYGQSALHIVGLFIMEQDGNIDESRLQ